MSAETKIKAALIAAKSVLATVLGGAASAALPLIQGDTSLLFSPAGRLKLLHYALNGGVLVLVAYLTHSPFHQEPQK